MWFRDLKLRFETIAFLLTFFLNMFGVVRGLERECHTIGGKGMKRENKHLLPVNYGAEMEVSISILIIALNDHTDFVRQVERKVLKLQIYTQDYVVNEEQE